ncbi:hypothetical protein BV898_04161 [Hypsibius exemplaris]|uniref:Uncharacterized protein n=1 Tax=Hypsibius exemplaris TaxID=2072580 RepID=A0A1W0X375_HYPEX|nr:hypothetical protein BV898_04161 [Hypsibius exemplaris]
MDNFQQTRVYIPVDRRGLFMALTVSLTVIVMALVTTAFWTASWMVFDDGSRVFPKPVMPFKLPFHKLGLWDICFRLYQPGNPWARYSVLCELMVKMPDFKASVPGFLIAVEIFYTIGFIAGAIGSITVICTIIYGESYRLLRAIGSLFIISGFLICLALIIFAACFNNRNTDNRMFQWEEHLQLGWSFWVAVGGGVSLWFCGGCYFHECRLLAHRLRNSLVTKIIC